MRSHRPHAEGFTLIELMIVIVIIGVLAAIAMPNFIAMRNRAKEAATRENMHTFQLAAEDYGIEADGWYADDALRVAAKLPSLGATFHNPFDGRVGDGLSWVDEPTYSPALTPLSAVQGIVAYADSAQARYCIAGNGSSGVISMRLSSGK